MEAITRGWRSVQHLVACSTEGEPFLRLAVGEQAEVVFVGEPMAIAVQQIRGSHVAVKTPTIEDVSNLHLLHNVFVPELGTVKVLAGDYTFLRRLMAWHYTCGTRNWTYLVSASAAPSKPGELELSLELGEQLDAAERSLIETACAYDLTDADVVQCYLQALQTESIDTMAVSPRSGAPS